VTGRSKEAITRQDLARLSEIACVDRERFFEKRPEYRDRVVCAALCQGAGLHYVDIWARRAQPNGIKDFDVWTFFAAISGNRFPADRRNTHVDFGPSKFGRWNGEPRGFLHYAGRRLDLFMRALPVEVDVDPTDALRSYLSEGRTKSANHLAAKGVVVIDPQDRRGEIVWPCRP
jgi:hypothetical protein